MKLKKLEITGFKSFLERTKIDFPPGISAIVGPNGCGKSNIVDALRWGMGEQSAKQLRGKAMEDIIFAGSDGKAPINMAEVSITFENDGSAPEELADYSEIMVTRRLFRSGERDYFLNKRPCRLKDIQDIFLGSGIGKKPFAIIKQGNVGAIADATPEERRVFIEEAAGVTRYKTRKEEALRKIKETSENLLRLKDIIGEVTKQMNSLRKQAKTAELYKEYRHYVKILEIRISSLYHAEFRNQESVITRKIDVLKDRLLQISTRLKQVESENETIRMEQIEKSGRIVQHKSSMHECQRKIDKAENDLVHFREDQKRLSEEITGLTSATGTLEEKNARLKEEVLLEKRENETLSRNLEEAIRESDAEAGVTGILQERLDRLNQTIKSKNTGYMELVASEARYKNMFQNAESTRETLERRLKMIDEEVLLSQKKAADLTRVEESARINLQALKEEKEVVDRQVAELTVTLGEAQSALHTHIKMVQGLETEFRRENSTHQALKKMDDNFEWYKDGVKEIMRCAAGKVLAADAPVSRGSAAETGGAWPVLGVMADMLTPEPGYETAVEAVLGEALQYILVDDHHAGVHFIGHLKSNNSGRSGFIPVSAIKTNGSSHAASGQFQKERLIDHVSVREPFAPVSEIFIGNVLIAEGMAEAISLWEACGNNGCGGRMVVTKAGDMISEAGILIGGSQERLSGILKKKQEIKSLEAVMAALGERIEIAYQTQKEMELAIQEMKAGRQEMLREKEEIADNQIMAEKALYGAEADLKHAKRHFDIVRLEQEQITGEADDIGQKIENYQKSLEGAQKEVLAVQRELTELNMEIQTVRAERDHYQQKILNLKVAVTELKTRFLNSTQTLKRLDSFLMDGEKRVKEVVSEIAEKEKVKASLSRQIVDTETRLAALYETVKKIEADLEGCEADVRMVNEMLQENEKRAESLKREQAEGEKSHRDLELEKSQIQIKIANLSERLHERFHQSLSELVLVLEETDLYQAVPLPEMESALDDFKEKLLKIGDVNLSAITEFEQLQERFDFLSGQESDLEKALEDLHTVIRKTNKITRDRFIETFDEINEKMKEVFPKLFEGGAARLDMTEPEKPLETGVELMIQPPGKKVTQLSLLSGGEKALSSIAFIFSIFLIKPASFCIMDEIDAPLDDANVVRFNNLLKIIGEQSQIIMITHNKGSMEFADTLFGVTMEKKGISKIVSVNFE